MASLWKGSLRQLQASVCFCRQELRAGVKTETVGATLCIWCFCIGSTLEEFGLNIPHLYLRLNILCRYFLLEALCFDSLDFQWECETIFYFDCIFFYCPRTSSSPLGPYSLVSTVYFIRLHAVAVLRDCSHTRRLLKAGADDLEILSQHLFSFQNIWGFLLDCFVVCIWSRHLPSTPLHSQTSRNETRLCHRGCGGALSAALTCTGRKLNTVSQTLRSVGKGGGDFLCTIRLMTG